MRRDEERTEGTEGVSSPTEGATMSTSQTPQSSQELNHQSKSTHGHTYGSSWVYNRRLPCLESLGVEPLSPVVA